MIEQIVLTFLATLGMLQAVSVSQGLEGLAWPWGPRHRTLSWLSALVLMAAALAGAFWLMPDAPPSPAQTVLALLAGVVLAFVVVILGAAIRLRWAYRRRRRHALEGQPIDLGPLQTTFYRPAGQGPYPAVCLLPDPTAPSDDLTPLIRSLVETGIAALVFDSRALTTPDRLTLQGFVAVGISHLTQWPETDADRIGLVGVGLGGDLALRGAAMDPGVSTVLAIEPVLSNRRPELGVEGLSALSWFAAHSRNRRWRRSPLTKELKALASIPCVTPRPVGVVVGRGGAISAEGNLDVLPTAGSCSLRPAAHSSAIYCATDWLKEQLS